MIKQAILPFPISQRQAEFRRSTAWCRGFVGGRSSGKTEIGIADRLLDAEPGKPYMIVSPTNGNLVDTTLPKFLRVAANLGYERRYNLRRTGRFEFYLRESFSPFPWAKVGLPDGGFAEFLFRSGEEPDRLAGPSMAGLHLDEASKMVEDVFKIGIPILRHEGSMGRLTLTFTPRGRRHWTFRVFYELADPAREYPADQVEDIGGRLYIRKEDTFLVRSHTLENPFNPPEFHDRIRGQYTARFAAQELAGEFVDLQGLLFDRFSFRQVAALPSGENVRRVRYWDRAYTAQEENPGAARSAGVLMSRTADGRITVEDVVMGRWAPHERNRIMVATAESDAKRWGNTVLIYFEQEGAAGKEVSQQTIRMLARFPVFGDVVGGRQNRTKDRQVLPGEAKVVRAQPFAAQVEGGNVSVMAEAPWLDDYLEELAAFPESTLCDLVDASSGAYNKLAKLAAFQGDKSTERADGAQVDAHDRYGVQKTGTRASGNGHSVDGWFKR